MNKSKNGWVSRKKLKAEFCLTKLLRLADTARTRKLRLFAAACCRRVFTSVRADQAILNAEKHADKEITDQQLLTIRLDQFMAYDDVTYSLLQQIERAAILDLLFIRTNYSRESLCNNTFMHIDHQAAFDVCASTSTFAAHSEHVAPSKRYQEERDVQIKLLINTFYTIFRPHKLDPRWLTSNVVDLVEAIYIERAFEKMPILSDALMDAGCNNEEILDHCRSDFPKYRGDWVIDLILEKE